jgi:hypothetical protein
MSARNAASGASLQGAKPSRPQPSLIRRAARLTSARPPSVRQTRSGSSPMIE